MSQVLVSWPHCSCLQETHSKIGEMFGTLESTKDLPCDVPAKCANCTCDHISYSLKYPELHEIVAQSDRRSDCARRSKIKSTSMCFLNINGIKEKDIGIDSLLSFFDIVLLEEHLLTGVSVNFLHRSPDHIVFTTTARRIRDRPSRGLTCVINHQLCPFPLCVMVLMIIILRSELVTLF